MEKAIFIRDELMEKLNISDTDLKKWEHLKLVIPSGFTDHKIPCYSDEAIQIIKHIQKLLELGYDLEEIQKIVKKVGLPKTGKTGVKLSEANQYLTVGNLAEKVGVSPRTIKYWEAKGIIEPDMRSEGGFRLYSEIYIYLCQLILDLQLFGYTLENIKLVSDYFREFLEIQNDFTVFSIPEVDRKLDNMLDEIKALFDKMQLFKEGIQRWEDLLKKKKKEIVQIKNQNMKRHQVSKGDKRA